MSGMGLAETTGSSPDGTTAYNDDVRLELFMVVAMLGLDVVGQFLSEGAVQLAKAVDELCVGHC